jgi:hypothetical protein
VRGPPGTRGGTGNKSHMDPPGHLCHRCRNPPIYTVLNGAPSRHFRGPPEWVIRGPHSGGTPPQFRFAPDSATPSRPNDACVAISLLYNFYRSPSSPRTGVLRSCVTQGSLCSGTYNFNFYFYKFYIWLRVEPVSKRYTNAS